MCRKVIWFGLVLALLFAQKAAAFQYAFQVTFTDKNNTPYSFSSPLTYLSPRALARRATQGIPIDSTDLPVNPAYIDSVLTLTGGVFHETSRWLNMCMILLADSSQILNLAGKPYISNITLVGYYSTNLHGRASNITGNPYTNLSGQKSTGIDGAYYADTWTQTLMVNGNFLYDNNYQGQGKLIAVFDAGFLNSNLNPGFDSLRSSGRIVDSFDFVWHDNNVLQQDEHGAQVLSTMAGNWPGTFVGAAPLAMYALYLTEYDPNDQPLELDNMISAAERADSIGADIITESLGYDIFDYPPGSGQVFSELDGKTTVAAKAANIATRKGMLFVATAGNDGDPVPGWGNHILTPGDADSALTIGSTDNTGTPAVSSGYGPNAAGQVKPDVSALGQGAALLTGSSTGSGDGTSFSTPQVAGWAACLWQANPGATPYQVRQAIIRCASSYSSPGVQLGYGIPNFACTAQLLNVSTPPPPFSPADWVIATPNPFNDEIKIAVDPDANGYVDFTVTDMAGRKVAALHEYCYKGYNTPLVLSMPYLCPGIYILKAVSSAQQQVIKLEKN